MQLQPIGRIHTPFWSKDECPIQPAFASAEGRVELLPEYADCRHWEEAATAL